MFKANMENLSKCWIIHQVDSTLKLLYIILDFFQVFSMELFRIKSWGK